MLWKYLQHRYYCKKIVIEVVLQKTFVTYVMLQKIILGFDLLQN